MKLLHLRPVAILALGTIPSLFSTPTLQAEEVVEVVAVEPVAEEKPFEHLITFDYNASEGVVGWKLQRYAIGGVRQMANSSDGWLGFANPTHDDGFEAIFYAFIDDIDAPVYFKNTGIQVVDP
jgi:hypothetical protein